VNSQDLGGLTPLSGAAQRGHVPIVKMLLATSDINVNAAGSNRSLRRHPLAVAADSGHAEVVGYMWPVCHVLCMPMSPLRVLDELVYARGMEQL
jgi:hypothetical protein